MTLDNAPEQEPCVAAAYFLDFPIPWRPIFDRKRSHADAAMRRVAKSVMRRVIESANPFFVQLPLGCADHADAAAAHIASAHERLREHSQRKERG